MLVLSRKVGEKIIVGNDIILTVASIRGDKVRIGIDAPDEVKIVREEIKDRFSAIPQGTKSCPNPRSRKVG